MRVLIALVGEQPTPNLIPLFAMAPEERAESVQFMVSDKPEVREVAKNLRAVITRDPALSGVEVADPDLPMDAWGLDKARADCEAAISRCVRDGHSVTVNLTGGTKIMSLAAYQAAVNTTTPMLYVNTERRELVHFDGQGKPIATRSFRASISIATQLRAAGREFKRHPNKLLLRITDLRTDWVEFARYLVDRYVPVHVNLIRKVLNAAGKPGQSVTFAPQGQSVEAARRAHQIGLWKLDESAGTITIADQEAFVFLSGGWVEVLALKLLADDDRFDDVLGNVEVEGFAGELDVVVARNGRLGIVECKTTGPSTEEGKTFAVAKIRLHEVIFGGPYAMAMFALPSNENFHQWQAICDQYHLPEPICGPNLKQLADEMSIRLGP